MKLDRNNVKSNLPKKGFEMEDDNHHIYFHHIHNGKRSRAYTYVSHSKKDGDLRDGIIKMMKKQLVLDTNKQVSDLVNCPMSSEQYIEHLKAKGVIS